MACAVICASNRGQGARIGREPGTGKRANRPRGTQKASASSLTQEVVINFLSLSSFFDLRAHVATLRDDADAFTNDPRRNRPPAVPPR